MTVATTYGSKDIEIVEQEIATYAGWGLRDPSLAVAGVFLDETPWQYSPEADQYFQRIKATVSSTDGLLGSFIGESGRRFSLVSMYVSTRQVRAPSMRPLLDEETSGSPL